jgi:hypothetical protein
MEALLSLWRPRATWLRADGAHYVATAPKESQMAPDEWRTWSEILRVADVMLPRTSNTGLEAYARLHGLEVDSLKAQQVVLTLGQRAATRWLRGARSEAAQLGGYSWSLTVRPSMSGLDLEDCKRALHKRFREVSLHGDDIVASSAWEGCAESVSLLLADAIASPTSPERCKTARGETALCGE